MPESTDLAGRIEEWGVVELFQLIHARRRTGVFSIQEGERTAQAYFENGAVRYARSSDGISVGEVLLKQDKISPVRLQELIREQETLTSRPLLGTLVVSSGAVSQRDLDEALRVQVTETLYGILTWETGVFAFEQRPIDMENLIAPIDVTTILLEGIWRLDEWAKILQHISLDDVYRVNRQRVMSGLKLEPAEWKVLAMINGRRNVRGIIATLDMPDFEVCRSLYVLSKVGAVEASFEEAELPAVLVVQPNDNLARIVEITLTQHGFKVDRVRGGEEALKLAREDPPAVILLDTLLDDLETAEVVRALEQDRSTAFIPIVFLTDEAGEALIRSERDGEISKPFSPSALVEKVKRTIEFAGKATYF
jgi:CheY-like chemotaxis protein